MISSKDMVAREAIIILNGESSLFDSNSEGHMTNAIKLFPNENITAPTFEKLQSTKHQAN